MRVFPADFKIRAGDFGQDMLFFFCRRLITGDPSHGSINDTDHGPLGKTAGWLNAQKFVRSDFIIGHVFILTHPVASLLPETNNAGQGPALLKDGRCRPEEKLLLFLHCFFNCFFLYSFFDCFFRGLFDCFFLGCHWRSPKNCDLKRSRPTPDTRCLKIMLPDDSKIYTQKSTIGKNNPGKLCGRRGGRKL